MRLLFVFLFLLGLVSCRDFPTQEEMDKAVQFASGAKFCAESEGVDILSLTDSKGKNIREYHKPDWDEEYFKYLKYAIARYDQSLGGVLSRDKNKQIVRLYRDSKPFTGRAKLCLDSFAIELMRYPMLRDYWIKKKAVVMEEVDVVNGWLNGEYIQYDYRMDNDWKTLVTFKKIKKYKKGIIDGLIEENGMSGNYVNGKKEGLWTEDYGRRKGEYLNGKRIGVWTDKYTNDYGQFIDSITYEEGKVVTEKSYKNGKIRS